MKKRRRASTRRGAAAPARTAGRHVHVRMYNVGFGDCFLLRIPTDAGERRMLVDCGYHSQGKGKFSDVELVNQIKSDLDGQPLHVVVATHRHQDHISGFGEKELWKDVAVEEVWLPFTAHPDAANAEPALRDWNALMEAVRGLWDANGQLKPAAEAALGARPFERRAAEFMLWNARANAPGIENLREGFRRADGRQAKRRFLPDEKDRYPTQFITPVLPGVVTHVLGPPRDPKFRKNKKVPSSWGFGEALGTVSDGEMASPFPPEWRVDATRLPSRRPFQEPTLSTIRLFNDDLLYAANALEGFLNGESLVLVLQVGSARLLLTGDAEVGAWTTILDNETALGLAASATFLKIGHHGSHNATPLVFIREHVAKNIPALISTQKGPGQFRNGIPFDDLIDALDTRSLPYARSDEQPPGPGKLFTPDPGGRWIDCAIPC
jgi:beta-lactamase superfamily II metal-dependent hydrolase